MIFFFLALIFQGSLAQFKGVLHYENDYVGQYFGSKGKVLTTIYESDPMIRIEANDTDYTKKDVTKQNILLIDISKGTETHLVPRIYRAIVYKRTDREAQAQMMNDQTHTIFNFQNLGPEKIGNFDCTHFVMTKSYANLKTLPPARYDIWITGKLGSSDVWYVGRYLYLFKGMDLYKKLADAGADGVVVKWKETESSSTTCILLSDEQKGLPASTFAVPANYSMMNAPNIPLKK